MEDAILKALLSMGTGGVVGAIGFFMWWRTDGKLDKLQDRYATAMEASNASRVDLATALNRLADKITGAK